MVVLLLTTTAQSSIPSGLHIIFMWDVLASVIQLPQCSNFMARVQHPSALQDTLTLNAPGSGFATSTQHPRASPAPS